MYEGFVRQIAPEEVGGLLDRFGIREALAKFAKMREFKWMRGQVDGLWEP